MRLIVLDIENDDDLRRAKSLLAVASADMEEIKEPKSRHIEALLQWCDRHEFTLEGDVIPSREERNAR
ncbi:hypothetical protein [Planktothricoides raciborskii]|uniref:Uncharacterized protein n=1 Tax=Planktothricoides raciborskii FACHB-1370 TaxID=2949576 RepID=A0ABR8E7N5_9CYAN|nr:hypothetical protein [Planktothricoides raciborskii]MBD2542844.1 hypothetical protein [Planktothricoides raciborskii FACHB-1370]MBD2581409.1 hypothetical protein [Planktothricoides raciborskii FACHB-1261]